MNVNETRPEIETEPQREDSRDSRPAGVSAHDEDHLPRKHDPKRTIMVVCGFVAALAMLIGLNMK